MELKRVGVLSCAKVAGCLYGGLGLLIGGLISLASLVGAAAGSADGQGDEAMAGLVLGVGAVVIIPIIYGSIGALMAAIMAALYNLIAKSFGGLELEIS